LIATNCNGYVCVLDSIGSDGRCFEFIYASEVEPILGSSEVLIGGSSSSYQQGGIYWLDLASRATRLLVSSAGYYGGGGAFDQIQGLAHDPFGDDVAFCGERSGPFGSNSLDLYKIPIEGGSDVLMLESPVDELYPSWSPDGTKILFCSNRSGRGYNLYTYKVR
jgi:Tol biopolymer transport system component